MNYKDYKLPLTIDYFSKITENDDIPFEKIEEIQKKVTAIRIKYRIKIILKP